MKNETFLAIALAGCFLMCVGNYIGVRSLYEKVTALEQQKSAIIEHERAHLGEKDKK